MKLAFTMGSERGEVDRMLRCLSVSLIETGLKPAGLVQLNTARSGNRPCDMDVQVLPAGPIFRISQSLGRASKGCRLDPDALESAVGLVDASLSDGADIMIVNKFGKHGAKGRGFCPVIARALELDIPVLVGLNTLNRDAFFQFSTGLATELPPKISSLETWAATALTLKLNAA